MHRDPAVVDAATADAATLRAQGIAAYAAGDVAGAQALLQAALARDPFDHQVLGDLAAIALQSGDAAAARRWAQRALALEPDHDPSAVALGCALVALGEADRARRLFTALTSGARGAALRSVDPALAQVAAAELAQLDGRAPPARVEIVDPHRLSLAARFDVLVKYLYALQRLDRLPAWVDCDPAALYAKHIHLRTGGAEPGDEARKASLADFVTQFDALIDAMAASGFDAAQPIPLSADDGLLRNGAHRLAAALAVGCDVAITAEPGPGGRWDHAWFVAHGFTRRECALLLRTWAHLAGAHAGVVVLWGAVEAAWPQLEADIAATLPVVAARTLELPRAGFDELVHDIYSFDWGPCTGPNIHRKVERLAASAPRLRVLFVERPPGADEGTLRALKTRLRTQHAALAPVEHYTTLHVTESAAEARHLLAIFTSENNLRWLARRGPLDGALAAKLDEMCRHVRERGIDPADCCVVGASVLDALGLRRADDVDFTLRSRLRFAHFDGGVTHLSPTVDVVALDYPRSFGVAPAPTDDRMIDDPSLHFLVRGIRFADPAVVLTRKQHQRRAKDLRDVALLGPLLD